MSAKNKRYVIVRTYSAGVFAGVLESRSTNAAGFFECVLTNCRRLWYWAGAASLSQLAQTGTSKPDLCKFPVAVDREELAQGVEIIDVTEQARKSIEGVPEWKS
jgi:hypothetical protein